MGAKRLANKMLLYLHGKPICEWVFRRTLQAKELDLVVFALTSNANDDVLEWYLTSIGATVFRGSEDDLVDRYYKVALQVGADRIVRVCADNPLICGSEIDRLIKFYDKEECDYAYNHIPKENKYPDGLGAEICSMGLLTEIYHKSSAIEHREHLFNYIWKNQSDYIIKTFNPPSDLSYPNLKLDLDTMEDYMELKKIMEYKP